MSLPLLLSIIIHVAVAIFALKAAVEVLVYLLNLSDNCYRNDWRCRQECSVDDRSCMQKCYKVDWRCRQMMSDLRIVMWNYLAFTTLFGLVSAFFFGP